MPEDTTAKAVAAWMAAEFEKHGELYQQDTVATIADKFGTEFTYANAAGNLAIARSVLNEFRKLTEQTAVWEARERYWRKREAGDDPNVREA